MGEVLEIGRFVVRALVGVLPAFLASVGLGVLIRALRLDGTIRRAVDARGGLAVVLATGVGAFSPLCSCTVIPVVSGLLMSGVPLAPVMAFWVASPTMDPEMFALTVATLGWPLAVARLGATLALSLGAGYLTLALTRTGWLAGDILRPPAPRLVPLRPLAASRPPRVAPVRLAPPGPIVGGSGPPADACCAPAPAAAVTALGGAAETAPTPRPATPRWASGPATPGAPWPGPVVAAPGSAPEGGCCSGASGARPVEPREPDAAGGSGALVRRLRAIAWPAVGRDIAVETGRLGRWLALAFLLEALILRYVPQAAIAGVLGAGNGLAVVLAALVGIPLYLNNVSALPIVSGLLTQGMQPGAAVAFLIAGPVTTVPAMSAVWGVVRPRVFALYLGISLVGAVVLGYLTNAVLG
jgi:hypothetical protein